MRISKSRRCFGPLDQPTPFSLMKKFKAGCSKQPVEFRTRPTFLRNTRCFGSSIIRPFSSFTCPTPLPTATAPSSSAARMSLWRAGRQYVENRSGLRNPHATASLRSGAGRNRVNSARLFGRIVDHHGRAWLRARRQLKSGHDSFEAWILLEERDALHRERPSDRIFSHDEIARQQHMDPPDATGGGSRISGPAIHRELPVQKTSGRLLMEPHSLLGE